MKRTIVFTFLACACIGGLHADVIDFTSLPAINSPTFSIPNVAPGIDLTGACTVGFVVATGCLATTITAGLPPFTGSLGQSGGPGLTKLNGEDPAGILVTFSEPVDFEGVLLVQGTNGAGPNSPTANVLNCGSSANCSTGTTFLKENAPLAVAMSNNNPTLNTFSFPSSDGTTFLIQAGPGPAGASNNSNQANFGIGSLTFSPVVEAVPDPGSTLGLLGTGLIGLAGIGLAGKARRKLKLWTCDSPH